MASSEELDAIEQEPRDYLPSLPVLAYLSPCLKQPSVTKLLGFVGLHGPGKTEPPAALQSGEWHHDTQFYRSRSSVNSPQHSHVHAHA